jgi:hypothetical protein
VKGSVVLAKWMWKERGRVSGLVMRVGGDFIELGSWDHFQLTTEDLWVISRWLPMSLGQLRYPGNAK